MGGVRSPRISNGAEPLELLSVRVSRLDRAVPGGNRAVLFVPAHLAEQVISTAEFVIRKDQFGFEMVRTGKYSTGEIDSQWTNEIKTEFLKWLEKHPALGKMTREELDKVMSKRTW